MSPITKRSKVLRGIYTCPVCSRDRKLAASKHLILPNGYVKDPERYRMCKKCAGRQARALGGAPRKGQTIIQRLDRLHRANSTVRSLSPEEIAECAKTYKPPKLESRAILRPDPFK